jgi:NhaA family Na+:H+ antiporter
MKKIKELLQHDSASGLALLFATVIALIFTNSFLESYYINFLNFNLAVGFNHYELSKPLYLWINDGLMAVFFFLVGLELKSEMISGHLSKFNAILLPLIAAIGGIIVPVLIFSYLNYNNSLYLQGWAIPSATDIAFALAVLSCCSKKVPSWAYIFLLSLAVFDDLVAIIIIAIFYTSTISYLALTAAGIAIVCLILLNIFNVKNIFLYILVGLILWLCVLESGVHATLAGVVTAILIPLNKNTESLQEFLKPWVSFIVLPLFAFANTGINIVQLVGFGVTSSISIGSSVGLFLGKQIGVFLFSIIGIVLFKYEKPHNFNYKILYGLSVLCGIGFTMSIFIASLAFGDDHYNLVLQARAGILMGSLLSAILGFLILKQQFKILS